MVTHITPEISAARRELRAEDLAGTGAIRQSGNGYRVQSQTRPGLEHYTTLENCGCEDWQMRHPIGGCKHMRALRLERSYQGAATEYLTCSHCGHSGPDVRESQEYVGGKGYVPMVLCGNRAECWGRWDSLHGLAG